MIGQIELAAQKIKLIFAVHPRTRARLKEFALEERLDAIDGLTLCEPLSYIQFMNIVTGLNYGHHRFWRHSRRDDLFECAMPHVKNHY